MAFFGDFGNQNIDKNKKTESQIPGKVGKIRDPEKLVGSRPLGGVIIFNSPVVIVSYGGGP